MSEKYCVFWYPTIFHGELNIKKPEIKTKDISDKENDKVSHHVSIELCANKNLVISSYLGNESTKRAEVILEHLDNTKSGFFLYRFNIQNGSSEAKFLEKAIPLSIYHLAKTFYHEHELKEGGGDATLPALISDTRIEIRGKNNDCLKHYLEVYERKFKAYAEDISEQNSYLKEIESNPQENLLLNFEKRGKLINLCENAIIEYVYCKAILGSKHNRSCHPNIFNVLDSVVEKVVDPEKVLPESDDNLYKKALNIRNAMRYITFVKETNWLALSQFALKATHKATQATQIITKGMQEDVTILQKVVNAMNASIKSNDKLAIISLILGAVSLIVAFFSLI